MLTLGEMQVPSTTVITWSTATSVYVSTWPLGHWIVMVGTSVYAPRPKWHTKLFTLP